MVNVNVKSFDKMLFRVKVLLVNKNGNAAGVFSICIEHQSKGRNRGLGFLSVG